MTASGVAMRPDGLGGWVPIGGYPDAVRKPGVAPKTGMGLVYKGAGEWEPEYLARKQDLDLLRQEFEAHHHDKLTIPWTAVTFSSGWVDYSDPNFGGVKYMRDATGTVFIRGMGTAPATPISVAFTLPAGCKPGKTLIFVALSSAGVCDYRIDTGGQVFPNSVVTAGAWLSFTCSFKAEA